MTYLNFEKFDEALMDLSKAIELKPDYGKAYWLRGEVKRIRHMETFCADYTRAAELGVSEAAGAVLKYCQAEGL